MNEDYLLVGKHLLDKMLKVQAEVEKLPKRGWNEFHKYNYILEADVVEQMRNLFTKHRLVLTFSVRKREAEVVEGRKGTPQILTRLLIGFTLHDVDSGESATSDVWSEGMDSGDKGIYKAYTGALKYFLIKTFLIPGALDADFKVAGLDPEIESPEIVKKPKPRTGSPADVPPNKVTLANIAKWIEGYSAKQALWKLEQMLAAMDKGGKWEGRIAVLTSTDEGKAELAALRGKLKAAIDKVKSELEPSD